MVDKSPIWLDKLVYFAMFCPIFKTVCPICWTVCPICCEFVQSAVLCVQSAVSWNFLLSDQICFVRTHRGHGSQFLKPCPSNICVRWNSEDLVRNPVQAMLWSYSTKRLNSDFFGLWKTLRPEAYRNISKLVLKSTPDRLMDGTVIQEWGGAHRTSNHLP